MGRHWIVALPARDDEVVAGSGGADDGAMVVFGAKSRRVALQLLFFVTPACRSPASLSFLQRARFPVNARAQLS